jgi:HlyD family secretion protein
MLSDLWDRLAALAAAALAVVGIGGPSPPTWLQGYGEAEYVLVAAGSEGELAELRVVRGDEVVAGARLFALDTTELAARRAAVAAELAMARAELVDLRKGDRPPEIAALEARRDQAVADRDYAATQVQRLERLVRTSAAAQERLDAARADHLRHAARVAEMEALLDVAKLGARNDRIAMAEARVAAAAAELARADRQLAEMTPGAPAAGRIEDTFFRVGERVPAQRPVVSLLPPGNIKLRLFVPEPLLPRFAPGTELAWRCDGCPDGLTAEVRFVASAAEYTPPVIYSVGRRERLVYLVEAVPTGPFLPRPGQPVDVRVPEP